LLKRYTRPVFISPRKGGLDYPGRPVDAIGLELRGRVRIVISSIQAIKVKAPRLNPLQSSLIITPGTFCHGKELLSWRYNVHLHFAGQRCPYRELTMIIV
jgi:hypothetical protein